MWKKLLSLNLAILLLLSSLPMMASAETAEVAEPQVATQSTDDTFTRGSFAQYVVDTLLCVDLTIYSPDSGTTLSDVTADHANYKAIAWCVENGCLSTTSGNFNPTGNITRAEVAQAVYDLLGIHDQVIELGGDYRDHPNGEAISFAIFTTGIMSAEGGVGFRPDDNAKLSDINADMMPKTLFYHGNKTLSVKAGERTNYNFSDFTDINGNALSSDDITALGNTNYINRGDSNYFSAYCDSSQITVNTLCSLPGQCATLFFYDTNSHVKYILDVTTTAPEWGVYWTKTKNNDTYITSISNTNAYLNTYADETVYIIPPTGVTLSSVNKSEDNSDVYTVAVEDNTVKLTYTGEKTFDGKKTIDFSVAYTENGQTQTKELSAQYYGTNKMSSDGLEKIVLGVGESTGEYWLGLDNGYENRVVRPNEFTLSFTGLTGVTATHKNAQVSLSSGKQDGVGAKGQLVATSKVNGATFTIDVEIDYPLVGLYSTSTKSEVALIGDNIDLTGNTDDTVTYYFIARDGYTFIDSSLNLSNSDTHSYTLSQDKTTVTVTVNRKQIAENGWGSVNLWLGGRVEDANGSTKSFNQSAFVKIPSENNGSGNGGNSGNNNSNPYWGDTEPANPEVGKIYLGDGSNELNITVGDRSNIGALYIYENSGSGTFVRRNLGSEDSDNIMISGGFATAITFSRYSAGLSSFDLTVTKAATRSIFSLVGLRATSGYLVYTNNGTTYTLPVSVGAMNLGIQNPDYQTIYYQDGNTMSIGLYENAANFGGRWDWELWQFVVYEPDTNGNPAACVLDGSFEYAINGVRADIGYYENDVGGHIEIVMRNVRTYNSNASVTATRNGMTHTIPLEIYNQGITVCSQPDPTPANFISKYIRYTDHPEWKTSYVCLPPNSQDTFSNVYVTDSTNGEFKCTLSDDGKYIKAECKPLDTEYSTSSTLHYTVGGENQTMVLWASSSNLLLTGETYMREKSIENLWTSDGESITNDYKVEMKIEGTSIVLPTKWIDETSLLVNLTGLSNEYATANIVATATKGNKTYVSRSATCVRTRSYSIYSAMPTDEDFAEKEGWGILGVADKYFKAAPGETVTYTDTNREFYLLGETRYGYYPIISATSDNPNIIVEPTYNRTELNYGEVITGNIAVKITVKDGVDTAQSAKITLKEKICACMTSNNREYERTKDIIVNLAPDNLEDATFSQGTFAELLWKIITGIANEIKDRLEISGEGDIGAHSSEIRFDGVRNDVTDLELGEGVGDIGDGAFKGFDKLEKVELPDTTTKIGAGAFEGCENLEEITIPGSVGEIDDNAFANTNEDFVIKGEKGDNYSETYAMKHNIKYESTPDKSYRQGDMQMELDKVISCDNRVAVTAKIDNGTSNITDGYAIAAVYYNGQLIATQVIDNEMNINSIERIVMQLPYLQDIDASKLDVKIMYLDDNKQPAVKSAKKNGYNPSQPMACAVSTTATEISSTANAPIQLTATDDTFSIDYTGVTKGDEYALMVVKTDSVGSAATLGEINSENLLYIDQQTAGGTTVSFSNFSLKDNENANVFIADKTGVKHIAYIGETAKAPVTVTVSVNDITYGETVKPTATSNVSGAVYSYHYEGTGSTVYDSDTAPKAAGTYKVTATLVSKTHSGTGTANFTIAAKNISTCTVDEIEDLTANGKEREPKITVKDGFTNLVKDKDFTVAYKNNTTPGTATVTIKGIGNYGGTTTAQFTIEKGEDDTSTKPVTPGDSSSSVDETEDENTVTLPNGNTATTEKTEEKTMIILVSKNGETIAEINLPAKPDNGKDFTDVKDGSWYKSAVDKATGYGIFNGVSESKFAPKDSATRSMIAQTLYNLSGKTGYGTGSNNFTDSKGWYQNAVNWAATAGIVSGTGNGKFEPEEEITREQLVVMLYNFAQAIGNEGTTSGDLSKFADSKNVSSRANEAMHWAVANGLMNGSKTANGVKLNPKDTATRAEVATVLVNFVEYLK